MEKFEFKFIDFENIKPYYLIYNNGLVYSNRSKKFLKPTLNIKTGYLYVSLMNKKNKPKKFYLHELVGKYFVNGFEPGLIIDHIDTNKINNFHTNLEWVSYAENTKRARDNRLIPIGEDLSYSILSNDQVKLICELLSKGKSYSFISKKLGVTKSSNIKAIIISIKRREKWKHISDSYEWSSDKRNSKFSEELLNQVCQLIALNKGAREICNELNYPDYQQIKKLVWFIKKGKVHKHIAEKYGII